MVDPARVAAAVSTGFGATMAADRTTAVPTAATALGAAVSATAGALAATTASTTASSAATSTSFAVRQSDLGSKDMQSAAQCDRRSGERAAREQYEREPHWRSTVRSLHLGSPDVSVPL
jgi:hypothetical protein